MTDTLKPANADHEGTPAKEPILMNWLIIIATVGVVGFGTFLIVGA